MALRFTRVPSIAVEALRLFVVAFGAGLGYQIAVWTGGWTKSDLLGSFNGLWAGAILGALVGYVVGGVLARLAIRTIDRGERALEGLSAEQVVAGAGLAALSYNAQTVTDSRTELGLRTDKSIAVQDGVLTLRGRAAWVHDFDPGARVNAAFQTLPGTSFVVFGAAIGSRITEIEGVSYGAFIVPGLIMLTLLTQSTMNASFGIYFPRFTGTIYEILSAPVLCG